MAIKNFMEAHNTGLTVIIPHEHMMPDSMLSKSYRKTDGITRTTIDDDTFNGTSNNVPHKPHASGVK